MDHIGLEVESADELVDVRARALAAGAVMLDDATGEAGIAHGIHGEQDAIAPLGPAREAVRRLTAGRAEEHVYLGERHEVLNETNRDEVLEDVVAFAQRAVGARTARGTA